MWVVPSGASQNKRRFKGKLHSTALWKDLSLSLMLLLLLLLLMHFFTDIRTNLHWACNVDWRPGKLLAGKLRNLALWTRLLPDGQCHASQSNTYLLICKFIQSVWLLTNPTFYFSCFNRRWAHKVDIISASVMNWNELIRWEIYFAFVYHNI